ncbi:Transposase DDE domain-containing protein [Streptomyces atratus]|uniref:Transposase DDE domain-containing protein n=2 Tax=Streptomyces atratus TaxID=1893 RepID=A0A1K2FAZ1_STRAR|nr:Transposase DDE domain-containing protein [Streptomyces atratus]
MLAISRGTPPSASHTRAVTVICSRRTAGTRSWSCTTATASPHHHSQVRVRTEQQTPEWKARYAVRSGVEGTINEFAHGHGMRRCRYRGQPKTHLQHVLTAIAVNIERLSTRSVTQETPSPRPPTAFQTFLDQQGIPRSKSWRTLGT